MSEDTREAIIQRFEAALVQMRECSRYTPEDVDELENAAWDVFPLLKAQDETRLIYHYSRPNVYADLWLHCEKCGEKVDNKWRPKYCPGCGRAVKWEC